MEGIILNVVSNQFRIYFLMRCLIVNCLQSPEQNALGNILVLFLIIGLFLGVTSDWLWLIGKGW